MFDMFKNQCDFISENASRNIFFPLSLFLVSKLHFVKTLKKINIEKSVLHEKKTLFLFLFFVKEFCKRIFIKIFLL